MYGSFQWHNLHYPWPQLPVIISPTFHRLFQLIALQRARICKQTGRRGQFTLADDYDEEEDWV